MMKVLGTEMAFWNDHHISAKKSAIMSDMCDIYISEIKSVLRRADELIAQGRNDNSRST